MKGFMIYYPWEAKKNQGFIRMFQERGMDYDMDFSYVSIKEYKEMALPDFVLNRTRVPEVSAWYEEKGIPVFHPKELVELSNDKNATLCYLKQNLSKKIVQEKWCPESYFLSKEEVARVIEGEKTLPADFVIKSLDGHGGSEVFLSHSSWQEALKGKSCLLQERIKSDSQDLRVYILGGKIYQGILRTGVGDFRSNFSLGGKVCPYKLTKEQEDWICRFIEAFPKDWMGMVGMDFILTTEGKLIFNEVEEMVGCRMLYQCTGKDIVRDYISWLHRILQKESV